MHCCLHQNIPKRNHVEYFPALCFIKLCACLRIQTDAWCSMADLSCWFRRCPSSSAWRQVVCRKSLDASKLSEWMRWDYLIFLYVPNTVDALMFLAYACVLHVSGSVFKPRDKVMQPYKTCSISPACESITIQTPWYGYTRRYPNSSHNIYVIYWIRPL